MTTGSISLSRLDPQLCRDVAEGLSRLGFGFFVGCARGVDESFRSVPADSPWREDTWVACAVRSRACASRRQGLDASVAAGRPPRVPAAYQVLPADLFGVVHGYWIVRLLMCRPHPWWSRKRGPGVRLSD